MILKKKGKMIIWIILGLAAVAAAVVLIMMSPMLMMSPAQTGEIAGTGITAARNNRNAVYFLKTGNGYIAVDTGSNLDELEEALDGLNINPLDVTHVLLTHTDADHINGLNLFANAEVYIGEDEMQLLDLGDGSGGFGRRSLPDGFDSKRLVTLSDGQELTIGEVSVECLKTPGHTAGSMSFLVDGAYLFTGDALRINGNTVMAHPFSRDEAQANATINRLYELMDECQIVLTAHYDYHLAENLKIG